MLLAPTCDVIAVMPLQKQGSVTEQVNTEGKIGCGSCTKLYTSVVHELHMLVCRCKASQRGL